MHEPQDRRGSRKGGARVSSLSINSGNNWPMSIGTRSVSFWRR
jgi:hypothetical protein